MNRTVIYDKIIVIGLGKLAFQCAEKIRLLYDVDVVLYDVNDEPSRFLQVHSLKCGIIYVFAEKGKSISLIELEEKRILLLSVYNPFIIPSSIIEKENIDAINLHHSFLPEHPGMYAEAWAIYEQEKYSGITWHLMSSKVDAGEIIVRKKVVIDDKTTSYSLLCRMNDTAYEAFEEIIGDIMNGSIRTLSQKKRNGKPLHLKKDKPNNGFLELSWDASKISAFLRAYDYFVSSPFGSPKLWFDDDLLTWKKYAIEKQECSTEKVVFENNRLVISKNGFKISLIGIKKI